MKKVASVAAASVAMSALALIPLQASAASTSHTAYVHKGSQHAIWGYSQLKCKGKRVTIHPGETKKNVISIRSEKWQYKYKNAKGKSTYYKGARLICTSPPTAPKNHYYSIYVYDKK
jgi:hypothetical protein